MKRLAALWIVLGLVAAGAPWIGALAERDASPRRVVGQLALDHLESHVDQHAQVLRTLADQLGEWQSLPPVAVGDLLRATARRHLALRRLVVADPSGKIIAGHDAERRLGDERVEPGRLDEVLERREVLRGSRTELVSPQGQAGVVERLALAVPVVRSGGERPAYVGASLALGSLRRAMARWQRSGVRFSVSTRAGDRLFPCGVIGHPEGAAEMRVRSPRFEIKVGGGAHPGLLARLMASILALGMMVLGLTLWVRLDRRGRIGKPREVSVADEAPTVS